MSVNPVHIKVVLLQEKEVRMNHIRVVLSNFGVTAILLLCKANWSIKITTN